MSEPNTPDSQSPHHVLLPIFPLTDVVLFPGMVLPLHIFEPRYQALMADILPSTKSFGITLAESDEVVASSYPNPEEIRDPEQLHEEEEPVFIRRVKTARVGTIAQVVEHEPLEGGKMNIITVGTDRFVIETIENSGETPYLKAYVTPFTDIIEQTPTDLAQIKRLQEAFTELIRLNNKLQGIDLTIKPLDEPVSLSFQVAQFLKGNPHLQQELLELDSTGVRLRKEEEYLGLVNQKLAAWTQIEAAFEGVEGLSDEDTPRRNPYDNPDAPDS
ncbi:MAG: LON peptidase substrate-binding domain-containing protein [Cyanobacteria bacterium]|nr:LON peptidase substrate-binding domain-containing protein [Cyanobacteriota bacterium]